MKYPSMEFVTNVGTYDAGPVDRLASFEPRWDITAHYRKQPRNIGRGGNARDRRRTRRWMARHTVTVRDAELRLGEMGPDAVTVEVVGWSA